MRHIKYLYILIIATLAISCAKDDSSLIWPKDNPNFSNITIESKYRNLVADLGEVFIFEPTITQSIEGKELKYEWMINYYKGEAKQDSVVISHSKILKYSFKKAGIYLLRLKVTNEDNSQYSIWPLECRQHQKGLMVVSKNDEGVGNISFASELSEAEIDEGKELSFITTIIKNINPGIDLTGIIDCHRSITSQGFTGYLYLITHKHIYVFEEKSLQLIFQNDIENIKPGVTIEGASIGAADTEEIVLRLSDKSIYYMNRSEFIVYDGAGTESEYEDFYFNLPHVTGKRMRNEELYVDYSTSNVYGFVYYLAEGIVPYTFNKVAGDSENPLVDYNIITVSKMNGDAREGMNVDNFIVATKKSDSKQVRIITFKDVWGAGFAINDTIDYTASQEINIAKKTRLIACARYNAFFYTVDNKFYMWKPLALSPNNEIPTETCFELEPSKKITSIDMDDDTKHVWVGFYDEAATTEHKGGIYKYKCGDISIFNKGIQPVEKYEGIADYPMKVFYKTTGMTINDYSK